MASEGSALLASRAGSVNAPGYGPPAADRHAAPPGFGPLVAAGFAVNFIFGAGVLSVPYSFVHAGVLFGVLMLLFASVLSSCSMTWLAEVMGRAEGLQRQEPRFEITGRSVGVTVAHLCGTFLGPVGLKVYQGAIFLYSMASMWLYSTVFALSLLSLVPLPLSDPQGAPVDTRACDLAAGLGEASHACRSAYSIFVLLYAAAMAAVVSLDLREQKTVQLSLTAAGVTCVSVMIVTAVVALAAGAEPEADPAGGAADVVPLLEPSGFAKAFSCFLFAQLAQHGAPALTMLVERKEHVGRVFAGTFAFTCVFYSMLGLSAAALFRHGVASMVTLNWVDYAAEQPLAPWYAAALSFLVRLFPAVSVSAAFPIYAINLGDTFVMPGVRPVLRRWLFILPPAAGALLQSDVSSILGWTGLFGYLIAYVMPGLLQLESRRRTRMLWGAVETPCSGWFSADWLARAVVWFAGVGLVVSLVSMV